MSESNNETDAEIVTRVVTGDREAYALLVQRYEPIVRQFLAGRGLRGFNLDEAAQDVFVGVYRNLENLRQRSQFGSYLLTAAYRRVIDGRRSQRKFEGIAELEELPERRIESVPESSHALQAAIARLPEAMQVTLGLKYAGQHTATEIAEILGQSVNTITKTLSRAYAQLRADEQLRQLWQEGE